VPQRVNKTFYMSEKQHLPLSTMTEEVRKFAVAKVCGIAKKTRTSMSGLNQSAHLHSKTL
jgi:hypothetical protein